MSAKVWGWAEVVIGAILVYFGQPEGYAMIVGGLAAEAAIYFAPTPQQPGQKPIQGNIRQTDAWADMVYGTDRKGGVLAYANTTGSDNGTLDMVIAHAITDPTNGIDGFGDFWINDQVLRTRPATTWSSGTNYAFGDSIMVLATDGNYYAMVCKQAGVSGTSAPPWNSSYGSITIDNTIKWKNEGNKETDWTWDSTVCAVGTDGYVRPKSGYSYVHGHVTSGDFDGMIELWAYVGTQTTVDSTLETDYSTDPRIPWASTAVGKGVVYTHWRFTNTPSSGGVEQFQKAFGNTIPYKLEAVVRGEKVYDPRTSTTSYSENPALCVRDYLTRDPMNGGCGISASSIDDTNSTTPSANVCDQSITFADGTDGPRFVTSGSVTMGDKRKNQLQKILSSMAGYVVNRATSANNLAPIAIYSGSYSSPTTTVDETFLRDGEMQVSDATQDQRYNVVLATFSDKYNSYQSMSAPAVPTRGGTDFNTWTTDDGGEIDKNLQLDFVNDADHAQVVAGILANQSRYLKTVKMECNFKAIALNVFDRIYVDNTELGWSGVIVKVTRIVLRPDLGVDVYGVVDASSVWGSIVPSAGQYNGNPQIVATTPPSVSGLAAASCAAGVQLTWAAPDPNRVTRALIFYSSDSGATYNQIDTTPAGAAQYVHPLASGGTGYYKVQFSNGYNVGALSGSVSSASGSTLDYVGDTADYYRWKAIQQLALIARKSGENHVTDPAITDAGFWGGSSVAAVSSNSLTYAGNPIAANSDTSIIFNQDGRGATTYFKVKTDQYFYFSFDIVTAATGTALGYFAIQWFDASFNSLGIQYVDTNANYTAVGSGGSATGKAPSGAEWGTVFWYGKGASSGGNMPSLANPLVLLGSQTVIHSEGAQLGGPRNTKTSIWANAGSIQSANPLTVTYSSVLNKGVVSIAQHTLNNGDNNPVYNSGTVQIPNVSGTYYILAYDPSGDGGAVTYSYVTSAAAVMSAGDGYYYVGSVNYTAGSGGGTGGGGGGTLPP